MGIASLSSSVPTDGDAASSGAAELRALKAAVKASFTGFTSGQDVCSLSGTQLNDAALKSGTNAFTGTNTFATAPTVGGSPLLTASTLPTAYASRYAYGFGAGVTLADGVTVGPVTASTRIFSSGMTISTAGVVTATDAGVYRYTISGNVKSTTGPTIVQFSFWKGFVDIGQVGYVVATDYAASDYKGSFSFTRYLSVGTDAAIYATVTIYVASVVLDSFSIACEKVS